MNRKTKKTLKISSLIIGLVAAPALLYLYREDLKHYYYQLTQKKVY